jgi:hypothetical protein
MPGAADLARLYQGERIDVLVDELVRTMATADQASSTSQSPSFSRRAWLASRDEAVNRFVRRVMEELPPLPGGGPEVEAELRALGYDIARQAGSTTA